MGSQRVRHDSSDFHFTFGKLTQSQALTACRILERSFNGQDTRFLCLQNRNVCFTGFIAIGQVTIKKLKSCRRDEGSAATLPAFFPEDTARLARLNPWQAMLNGSKQHAAWDAWEGLLTLEDLQKSYFPISATLAIDRPPNS